ncbi:MAG: hypothetical protein QXZ13_01565 [Candidatus Diapherotrites archaeon]
MNYKKNLKEIDDLIIKKILKITNPSYVALLLLEFILSMIVLLGLLIYIDPIRNNIDPPFNFIIFAGIIFLVFWIYNYTKIFRSLAVSKRKTSIRIFMLELTIFGLLLSSLYFYKNTSINLLPYPFNIIFFLCIISIPLYFYIKEKFW